jgi:phosphate transporter
LAKGADAGVPLDDAFELHDFTSRTVAPDPPTEDPGRQQRRKEKLARFQEADEMKFSHSIQFNAVPDWSSHYIAYSNLKKL